jgi:hypothetical protein
LWVDQFELLAADAIRVLSAQVGALCDAAPTVCQYRY